MSIFGDAAAAMVQNERERQDAKWGDQSSHPDFVWLAILTEEVGEASQEILRIKFDGKKPDDLLKEMIQVAAVSRAWVEALLRRKAQ